MNILFLATGAYGARGGIAQSSRDLVDALAALPTVQNIIVLVREAPDPAHAMPPKATQPPARAGRLAFSIAALRAARQQPPDIVFCNHLFMAPLAALIARLFRCKLIVQLHGVEIWHAPSLLQRIALEAADSLWCVSRNTRARALAYAALAPEQAIVVNNSFKPVFRPGEKLTARARFGFGDDILVLTVGRLDRGERYKGHDRVMRALAQPASAHHHALYLIAGEGDDQSRLETLAHDLGVSHRVRFLGPITASDLPSLYNAADLFALPSTGEGFGIAFVEAMACGTPAIGLAAGGAGDALGDGELGICVPEREFATALDAALSALASAGARADNTSRASLSAAVHARFDQHALHRRVGEAVRLTQSLC